MVSERVANGINGTSGLVSVFNVGRTGKACAASQSRSRISFHIAMYDTTVRSIKYHFDQSVDDTVLLCLILVSDPPTGISSPCCVDGSASIRTMVASWVTGPRKKVRPPLPGRNQ